MENENKMQNPKEILLKCLTRETKDDLNKIIQATLTNTKKSRNYLKALYNKVLTSQDKEQILANVKIFNEKDTENDNILHERKFDDEYNQACDIGFDFCFYRKNLKFLFDYENFGTTEICIKNSYSTIKMKLDLLQYLKFNKVNNKINKNFLGYSTELFFNHAITTQMFINFINKNKINHLILLGDSSLQDVLMKNAVTGDIIKNMNGTVIIANNFKDVVNKNEEHTNNI